MDFILEFLIPVIFALIYFVSSIFSKFKDEDVDEEQQPTTSREQKSKSTSPPALPSAHVRPQPQRQNQEGLHPNALASSPTSRQDAHNDYEATMRAQLEQIEATRREAELVKQQAKSKQKSRPRQTSKAHLSLSSTALAKSAASIRETLANPQAARQAFIYAEVFGPPSSLRKNSSVPGLE